jgi:hypothetical protein
MDNDLRVNGAHHELILILGAHLSLMRDAEEVEI